MPKMLAGWAVVTLCPPLQSVEGRHPQEETPPPPGCLEGPCRGFVTGSERNGEKMEYFGGCWVERSLGTTQCHLKKMAGGGGAGRTFLSLVSGRGWRQRRLTLACGERDVRRTGPLLLKGDNGTKRKVEGGDKRRARGKWNNKRWNREDKHLKTTLSKPENPVGMGAKAWQRCG